MNSRHLQFNDDIGDVTMVQFGVLSPEEIERKAVCEIFTHETLAEIDRDINRLEESIESKKNDLHKLKELRKYYLSLK